MNLMIDTAAEYSQGFQEDDTAKSVIQNIALLLCTKKGTVPMYREFGIDMEFVDKPIDIAEAIAYKEVTEALERFEPRAKLKNLTFKSSKEGRMSLAVEVTV